MGVDGILPAVWCRSHSMDAASFTFDTTSVEVEPEERISDLKQNLHAKLGLSTDFLLERLRLVFAGKLLEDSRNLSDYNIQQDSHLVLVYVSDQATSPKTHTSLQHSNPWTPRRRLNSAARDQDIKRPTAVVRHFRGGLRGR